METSKELRRSKYFVMSKSVHRRKDRGRGAKFQNYKVTSYKISINAPFPSKLIDEARNLVNPDFSRVPEEPNKCYFQKWKFYNKRDADKAWVLLAMKYGG